MKKPAAGAIAVLVVFIIATFLFFAIDSAVALPSGSILINQGAPYTTLRTVTLTVSYADNASSVKQVRYSDDNSTWNNWETPSPTKAWTLASGDGSKNVYFQVKNKDNQVSPTYSDSIILDTIKPAGSIIVANGSAYTTKANVSLNLTASDATSGIGQMRLSNDGLFDTEMWETYASSKSWNLSSGDGAKTVWVKYIDNAGLESDVYNDTILLDGTPPSVAIAVPLEGQTLFTSNVTVTWSGLDAGSGLDHFEVKLDAGSWINKGTLISHTFPTVGGGNHTVYVSALDKAGNTQNVSRTFSVSLTGQISGKVVDASSGAAIASATVSYSGSISGFAYTNSSGNYVTPDLPLGVYSVNVSSSVYTSQTKQATVNPGSTSILDFQLQSLPGSIKGQVTEAASGLGLASASVSCFGTGSGSAVTDADGYYTISNLTSGFYQVTASKNGYANQTKSSGVPVGGFAGVDFQLQPIEPTPPYAPSPDDGVSGWSTANMPTFTWSASSNSSSSIAGYYWRVDSGVETWTTSISVTLAVQSDGSHTFYVKARDNAGNNSTYGSHVFQIDTTFPSGMIQINQGAQYTSSTSVTLTLTYSDAPSGIDKVRYSNDGVWDFEQWENPSPSKVWTLLAGDGTKMVYYQIKDKAGMMTTVSDEIVLSTSTPTGSISINNRATYSTTLQVILSLTCSSDANQVRYSNDGIWDMEPWELPSSSKMWYLTAGDGVKTVYYQLNNTAGTISSVYSANITLDTAPPMGSIMIASGAVYTTGTSVTLTMTSSDATSGVSQMRLSNDGVFDTEPWESNVASKSWTLQSGDGAKTVYVQYQDNAGLVSSVNSDTITLDAVSPEISVKINGGAQYTSSIDTVLTLTYSDATSGIDKIRFSNDGIWDTEQWESPSTTKNWALSIGDGTKTVYCQIRDKAGLITSTQGGIVLITSVPTCSISINGGATYATTLSVNLSLTYSQDTSQVRYSNDGVWDTEQWETPSMTRVWSLPEGDGNKTVYCQVKNKADTISTTYSDNVMLDTKPPTGSISINGGASYTNMYTLSLTIQASDATSGVYQMLLSTDGVFDTEQWENNTSSKPLTFSAGDGTRTVYAQFKDKAGLESSTFSDTIILDTTPPTGSIKINNDSPETSSTSVTLTLAGDDTNGVIQMRFSNDAASWSSWENYSATKAWTIGSSNGIQTVYVQFRDSAGLDSQVYSGRINFVTVSATQAINVPKVATPTFSPVGGTYSSVQKVMLSCSTVGAAIHFTIDGSEPSSLSPIFFTSILVRDTTTIKAKALKMWMTDSDTASATYTTNTMTISADTIPADPLLINYGFSVIAIVAIVGGVLLLWRWRASKQR